MEEVIQKVATIAQCLNQLFKGKSQNSSIGYLIVQSQKGMILVTVYFFSNVTVCMRINERNCCKG